VCSELVLATLHDNYSIYIIMLGYSTLSKRLKSFKKDWRRHAVVCCCLCVPSALCVICGKPVCV